MSSDFAPGVESHAQESTNALVSTEISSSSNIAASTLQFLALDPKWTASLPLEGTKPVVLDVKQILAFERPRLRLSRGNISLELVVDHKAGGGAKIHADIFIFKGPAAVVPGSSAGESPAVTWLLDDASTNTAASSSTSFRVGYLLEFSPDGELLHQVASMGPLTLGQVNSDELGKTNFAALSLGAGKELRLNLSQLDDKRITSLTYKTANMLLVVSRQASTSELVLQTFAPPPQAAAASSVPEEVAASDADAEVAQAGAEEATELAEASTDTEPELLEPSDESATVSPALSLVSEVTLHRDETGAYRVVAMSLHRGGITASGVRQGEQAYLGYVELPVGRGGAKLRLDLGRVAERREHRFAFASLTHTILLTAEFGNKEDVGDVASKGWQLEVFEGGADRWAVGGIDVVEQTGEDESSDDMGEASEIPAAPVLAALHAEERPFARCRLKRDPKTGALKVVNWHITKGAVNIGGEQGKNNARLNYVEVPIGGQGAMLRLELGRLAERREHRLAFASPTHTIVMTRLSRKLALALADGEGMGAPASIPSWSIEVFAGGVDSWDELGTTLAGASDGDEEAYDSAYEVDASAVLAALKADQTPIARCVLTPDALGVLRVTNASLTVGHLELGLDRDGEARQKYIRVPLGGNAHMRLDVAKLPDRKQVRVAFATAGHAIVLQREASAPSIEASPMGPTWSVNVYLHAGVAPSRPRRQLPKTIDEAQAEADAMLGLSVSVGNDEEAIVQISPAELDGLEANFRFVLAPDANGELQTKEILATRDGLALAMSRDEAGSLRGEVSLQLPNGARVCFSRRALDESMANELVLESRRFRAVLTRSGGATAARSWHLELQGNTTLFAASAELTEMLLPVGESPAAISAPPPDPDAELMALAAQLDAQQAKEARAENAALMPELAEADAIEADRVRREAYPNYGSSAHDEDLGSFEAPPDVPITWSPIASCTLVDDGLGGWTIGENGLTVHLGGRSSGNGIGINLAPDRHQWTTTTAYGRFGVFRAPGEVGMTGAFRTGALGLAGDARLRGPTWSAKLEQSLALPTLTQRFRLDLSEQARAFNASIAYNPKGLPHFHFEGVAVRDHLTKTSSWRFGATSSNNIAQDLGLALTASIERDSDGLRRFIEAEISRKFSAFAALSLAGGTNGESHKMTLTVSLLNPLAVATGNASNSLYEQLQSSLLQVFLSVEKSNGAAAVFNVGFVRPLSDH
ncbi:MAG: hypothetical protein IPL79_01810 [Myxococcales bacterium]|nr:hypothetical protein [Myxococcales bacterium]